MIFRYFKRFLEYFSEVKVVEPEVPQMQRAFDSSFEDVGKREDPPKSNSGPYIEDMRIEVELPQRGKGEWCALLQSVHLNRAGIPIKSRGAKDLVRRLGEYGRFVSLDSNELVDGFYGLSQHKRKGGHHVRSFHVYESPAGLVVRYVGGNEGGRVKTGVVPLKEFLSWTTKISTC